MNSKNEFARIVILVVAALLWWIGALVFYLHRGIADHAAFGYTFFAVVTVAMLYFRKLEFWTIFMMAIAWGGCGLLLPEYSMSLSDRLDAIWYANGLGFGGISLMAGSAVLAGVVCNVIALGLLTRSTST